MARLLGRGHPWLGRGTGWGGLSPALLAGVEVDGAVAGACWRRPAPGADWLLALLLARSLLLPAGQEGFIVLVRTMQLSPEPLKAIDRLGTI